MSNSFNGLNQLNQRRERRTRKPPMPRHPRADSSTTVKTAATEPQAPIEQSVPSSNAGGGSPLPSSTEHTAPERHTEEACAALPRFDIDLTDPDVYVVAPTSMTLPASIVARFKQARINVPSHTDLVLDALRNHAHELPRLILNRRPGVDPDDLFPARAAPSNTASESVQLVNIRATKGELAVMTRLVEWASDRVTRQRPGSRPVSRSEMIAASLDAYLPELSAM